MQPGKSFTSGRSPIFTVLPDAATGWENVKAATTPGARQAMGQTRRFAKK